MPASRPDRHVAPVAADVATRPHRRAGARVTDEPGVGLRQVEALEAAERTAVREVLGALGVGVALVFDFLNGLHDAANSIATIVSTRVLRPQYAVFWAAFFNFIAFLFFGLHVAETLGRGIIDPAIVSPLVIFAALMGAIVWNVVTWVFGIPSSSSRPTSASALRSLPVPIPPPAGPRSCSGCGCTSSRSFPSRSAASSASWGSRRWAAGCSA